MAALGIDLGTSNSCVAYFKDGSTGIICDADGCRTTPSAVAFCDGQIEVGKFALRQFIKYSKNVIYGVKYMIGRKFHEEVVQNKIPSWPFIIVNQDNRIKVRVTADGETKHYTPEEISGILLKQLKRNAEKQLNVEILNVVITIPTYFNDSQRQATIDAGKIAGFQNVKLLNEPTAAAIAYGIENSINNGKTILVFDLGGGTFDVSILKYDKEYKILAIDGDLQTGGDDVDQNLLKHICKILKDNHDITISNIRTLYRLKNMCEEAKLILSEQTYSELELFGIVGEDDVEIILNRTDFNLINQELFANCIRTVKECLEKIQLTPDQIDAVLLVGGSTRILQIQSEIEKYFGKTSKQNINPDEAVAIGAAIYSAKWQNVGFDDLKVDVICAHSMGVALYDKSFNVIIPRFSEIPIKISRDYKTMRVGNSKTRLKIYSGENKIAADNVLLGTFKVSGISNGPKGTMVTVTFSIDEDGILKVTAIDQNGKSEHLDIYLDKGTLTPAEIEEFSQKVEDAFEVSDKIKFEKYEKHF